MRKISQMLPVIAIMFFAISMNALSTGIGGQPDVVGVTEGHLTKNCVGTALLPKLGTSNFAYTQNADSLYPRVDSLKNHPASWVGDSPIYLWDDHPTDFDRYYKVRRHFTASRRNDVVWTSVLGRVQITPQAGNNKYYNVKLLSTGWDTLIASRSGIFPDTTIYRKVVPINITAIPPSAFYDLLVIVNPADSSGGTATGSGNYGEGWEVPIEAFPADCYEFVNWTNAAGTVVISTDNPYTVTITKNDTIRANFRRIKYDLTLELNLAAAGTVLTSGKYDCGVETPIKAIANECYRFVNWTNKNGAVISENADTTVILRSDSLLTANFVRDTVTVMLTSQPDIEECVVQGADRYACNSDAIIAAFSSSHCYKFSHWEYAATGEFFSNKFIDTLRQVKEDWDLVAVFRPDSFNVELWTSPTGSGIVFGDGKQPCEVAINTTGNECYKFINWRDAHGNVISDSPDFLLSVNRDTVLTAYYVKVDAFEVKVSASPTNGGVVTVNNDGKFDCPGGIANITATANPGFIFIRWIHKSNATLFSNFPNNNFTVNRDYDLVAIFEPRPDSMIYVQLLTDPQGAGETVGQGFYDSNATVPINVTANECYKFKHWADLNGTVISTNPSFTIVASRDTVLVAHFDVLEYTINLYRNPTDGGTTTGAGTFECNKVRTITATPNANYAFVNWTDNTNGNAVFSTQATVNITVKRDYELTANFTKIGEDKLTVTLVSVPTGAGILTGGGNNFDAGDIANIVATANTNYTFINWRDASGNEISPIANFALTVTKDTTLYAHFETDGLSLGLEVNPQNAGTVSGGGSFAENEVATISATANTCYTFTHWSDKNNNFVSDENPLNVLMTKDSILVANFELKYFDLELKVNPLNAGTAITSGNYPCGEPITITATANANYVFENWTDEATNAIISTNAITSITLESNRTIIANFKSIAATTLTFRADEHKLVNPKATNFGIPIYVSSTQDMASIEIEKLTLEISRNVFYPKSANNCQLTREAPSDIILEKLRIPALKANEEIVLTLMIGDVILGDRDSSAIILMKEVTFSEAFDGNIVFKDGHITLDICREGNDRLLTTFDFEPSIIVKNNPTKEKLEVECKVIENGDYILEIVDLNGSVMEMKRWTVDNRIQTTFNFDFSVINFGNGSYYVLLHTPSSAKYTHKFIVIK